MQDQDASIGQYTRVLLVCVYNKSSNVITHEILYKLFSPCGQVMRILIFVKAKVWKAFVEMDTLDNAKNAANNLNNIVIFQDGSKMVIYPSKLQQINFQNGNNGGMDYQQFRMMSDSINNKQLNFTQQTQNYFNWSDTKRSESLIGKQTYSTVESLYMSNYSFEEAYEKQQDNNWHSASKNKNRKRESTLNISWYDIDSQFQQIALQSQQYKQYREQISRPKSNTTTLLMFNSNQQGLLDITSSKVLYLRSIMPYHTIKSIFNILSNFGNVKKIINIIYKESMLVQFQHIEDAIQAKDFLNLIKNGIKFFFSHYKSLQDRQIGQDQQMQQYQTCVPKKQNFNPPSQTLHISYISQSFQQELVKCVNEYGSISQLRWQKHQYNNKIMLLLKMSSMQQAMKVMGFLQGKKFGTRYIKISFTRSKIYQQKTLQS